MPTLRTIFLKHRPVHVSGGDVDLVQSSLQLDDDGYVNGILNYDGQGFETPSVPQVQPVSQEQVFLSGDENFRFHLSR